MWLFHSSAQGERILDFFLDNYGLPIELNVYRHKLLYSIIDSSIIHQVPACNNLELQLKTLSSLVNKSKHIVLKSGRNNKNCFLYRYFKDNVVLAYIETKYCIGS